MKAFRYHNKVGEQLDENNKWVGKIHNITKHSISPQLWDILEANPNVPVYMKSYCDKEFRDKHPDVVYFPKKDT